MLRQEREQLSFAFERRTAIRAVRQMLADLALLHYIEFAARRKKNNQRLPFTALSVCHSILAQTHIQSNPIESSYRMSPRLSRSFLVARNREFFTVSSDVPSRSPMARNRSPW